jgi:amino acid permease
MGDSIPHIIGDNDTGKVFWLTLFCFAILLPMSLPRDLSALRHGSLVSLCISVFIVFTIFALSFRETKDNCIYAPVHGCNDFSDRFSKGLDKVPTAMGMFNSLSYIIFGFMYQPLIPSIHHELKKRTLINMNTVLIIGTGIATTAYLLCGIFGFVTFSMNPDLDKIIA